MLPEISNVLEKQSYMKLHTYNKPTNMADDASSAKIKAGQGTKIPILIKTKKISSKDLSSVSPTTLDKSPCAKCKVINKME